MNHVAFRPKSLTLIFWAMTCITLWAGCDIATPAKGRECDSAMLWLRLSKLDHMRCFIDKHAREAWIRETNIKLMEAEKTRVVSFNERLSILEPTGFAMEKFEDVSSVNDVPNVWGLSRDEKAQKHLGKRYAVDARISWSDSIEHNVDPTVWVHDLAGRKPDKSRMVNVHLLNDYQKRFLMEHCFSITPPSLCEGKIYLAIEWGPKWPAVNLAFVNLEFVGAFFRKAEGSALMPTDIGETGPRVDWDDWFKQQFQNAASLIDRLIQLNYTPTPEE